MAFSSTVLPADGGTTLTAACAVYYSGAGIQATCVAGTWQYTGTCTYVACNAAPATQVGAVAYRGITLPANSGTISTAICAWGYYGAGIQANCVGTIWQYSGTCTYVACDSAPVTQVGAVSFGSMALPVNAGTATTAACARGYSGYGIIAVCAASNWAYSGSCVEDALGNSKVCNDDIPKCEVGACATRNVRGSSKPVCLRCMANYLSVTDDSGQDNIVQCGEWMYRKRCDG